MGSFAAGAALLVIKKFSASKFWETASHLQATQVNIIAAVGNILSQRDRSEFKKHKIKKVYGAPVSPTIEKIFKEEFHIPITLEGYGMTEIPGAINNQIEGQWKIGTMGIAAKHPDATLPFTELKIIDDEEKEVSNGESGELVVKTPLLMKGYYKDEEQTKSSFTTDGWFKTGDLVKKDSEGFYVFVTRKKDIIRRRGENISGAEIDRIVSTHPKIAEVAAVGVASPLGEEDIFLAVVLRENQKMTEQELYEWCEKNLNKIKCPKFIRFFEKLPHTPTARVAKFKLKLDPTLKDNAVEF
jgi:crotonobetaine/carnitine-CoA ligase